LQHSNPLTICIVLIVDMVPVKGGKNLDNEGFGLSGGPAWYEKLKKTKKKNEI
jgi:hypothetical protein